MWKPQLSLRKIAKKIRISIIEQVYRAKSGHPGGSLSSADILTVLYFNQMNINEKEPKAILRDRFVLSKGHCAPVLYATLAEKGFFNKEELLGFRKVDGNLQGHPDMKKVAGVDFTNTNVFDSAIQIFDELIDEFEKLYKEL